MRNTREKSFEFLALSFSLYNDNWKPVFNANDYSLMTNIIFD